MSEEAQPERVATVVAILCVGVVGLGLWFWWPLGVGLGLLLGIAATVIVGVVVQRRNEREALAAPLELGEPGDDLWQEFRRLRVRLGDDWDDFADAAVLVTRSQWATPEMLERELDVPPARAYELLMLLEDEGFVGPTRGARPRDVLVAPDAAADLLRLLHA